MGTNLLRSASRKQSREKRNREMMPMARLHTPASLVRAGFSVYQAGMRVISQQVDHHQVHAQGPDEAVLEGTGW